MDKHEATPDPTVYKFAVGDRVILPDSSGRLVRVVVDRCPGDRHPFGAPLYTVILDDGEWTYPEPALTNAPDEKP